MSTNTARLQLNKRRLVAEAKSGRRRVAAESPGTPGDEQLAGNQLTWQRLLPAAGSARGSRRGGWDQVAKCGNIVQSHKLRTCVHKGARDVAASVRVWLCVAERRAV